MVDGFTRTDTSIVTTVTATQYLEVINLRNRFPLAGVMTVHTDIGGADVVETLAGGDNAIVAIRATANNL